MASLSLEHIEKEMAMQPVPGHLADYRVYLAALYSLRAAEMQRILGVKPTAWLAFRREAQSATEADRLWEATEHGLEEMRLKWTLRRIDKLSSAIGSKLRVMEAEARNII